MFRIVALGQAKIEDFRVAVRRHNHVRGLQVAVHYAAFVRVLQRAGDLPPVSQQRFHGHPAFAQELCKRPPLNVLHGDEQLAFLLSHFINSANIGVVQGRCRARFVAKALHALGVFHDL